MKLLGELAYARVGYTYRGSLKYAQHGNTAIIQTRDATPQAMAKPAFLARADLDHIAKTHFLIEGDLIFRARGWASSSTTNYAYVIPPPAEPMVCIAPLIRIRIFARDKLLPDYLSWYINLARTQEELQRHASISANGVTIIGAQTLESMPIALPPLAQQQTIVTEDRQFKQSQMIEAELAQKNLREIEQSLLAFATFHDCSYSR